MKHKHFLKKIFSITCFAMFFSNASAENFHGVHEERMQIAFGDRIEDFGGEISNQVTWTVFYTNENKQIASGRGTALTRVVYEKPGTYLVEINENLAYDPNTCNHNHLPEKLIVEVSPLKMEFDFKSVKISRNIIGGQSVSGTALSVEVYFSTYDNSDAVYAQSFTTAGVGTSVAGKLKNGQATLQQGINILEFQLEGQATRGTYIMIDFIDINGVTQSYSLANKIL